MSMSQGSMTVDLAVVAARIAELRADDRAMAEAPWTADSWELRGHDTADAAGIARTRNSLVSTADMLESLVAEVARHRELMQRLAKPVWRQIVGAWRLLDQEQMRAWNDERIALSRAFFDAAFRGAPVDDALMERALDFLEGKQKQPSQEAIDQTIAAGVSPTE